MTTEPSWRELAPPPAEVRGLGTHDGVLVALTGAGLLALANDAWAPLDTAGLGASLLPSGRLVVRRVAGTPTPTPTPTPPAPPNDGGVVEITALAIGPDGAAWTGVRTRGLSFYAAPGPGGMDMMHPAYPVTERLERDGKVVRKRLAVRDLAFDAHGRLWVATSDSLEVLDEGKWRKALPQATTQVAIAVDGSIVVGAPTAGFRSVDGVGFRKVPAHAIEKGAWGSLELDAENVQQIERAPDGALWARLPGGVLTWTGDRWASRNLGLTIIVGHGSRALRTSSLAVTSGAVYVATSAGVFQRARA